MTPEQVNYKTILLDKLKLGVITRVNRDFAMQATLHVSEDIAEEFVYSLRQYIARQKLETVKVEWPATWWEHVKQRFAPRWFLRRWPVRLAERHLEASALYPKVALPDQEHYLRVDVIHPVVNEYDE